MQRAELAAAVARKIGKPRYEVEATIVATLEVVTETLTAREAIYLRGFGTLLTMERRGKVGRDISRNTSINIPPHTVVKFKPSDTLKEAVKKGKQE